MQSATEQKEVADQRAFNHCDGVRPGAGLYHSGRQSTSSAQRSWRHLEKVVERLECLRSHDINVRGLSEE
jgi:hypothetical protein